MTRTSRLLALLLAAALLAGACSSDVMRRLTGSDVGYSPAPWDAKDDEIDYGDRTCHQHKDESEVLTCEFGDRDGDVHLVVVGDSMTEQYLPAMDAIGQERGWRITGMTKSACPFMSGRLDERRTQRNTSCEAWNAAAVERIRELRPDAVVNALYLMRGLDHETVRAGLARSLSTLADAGIPAVLLDQAPRTREDVIECLEEDPEQPGRCATPLADAQDPSKVWPAASSAWLLQRLGDRARVVAVDDLLCDADGCPVVDQGVLRYRDDHHLTATFVRSVAPRLGDRIAQALAAVGG
ncbi:SGNH hydrolase domain-containing protein [Aeromicrobium massiliense]|uniref:SGNH hydrolase domain-containing protein n=1 Tax=Aeromicrobium massiliense TaxID=1464554 RepID=UPI0002D690F3|nr:SGNH hydrolase domain-containing protein [Aeromicrobium massiliense]